MTDTPKARTSETHPLLISEIALPEGRTDQALAITFFPGKKEFSPRGAWDRDLDADLAVIRDWKPTDIIVIPTVKEQKNIGTKSSMMALQRAVINAKLHQTPEGQWPCPKDYLSRDIDALPTLMTTPGRRVLIIGRYGQERSAVLAVEILLRDGVYRDIDEAKFAVERGREGSLATAAQHSYLDHYWKRRRLKGGPTHVVSPIDACKARATRLRTMLKSDGIEMSHSQALERLAHMEGLKNWSTLRARQHEEEINAEAPTQVTARWSLLRMFDLSFGLRYLKDPNDPVKGGNPRQKLRTNMTMRERYKAYALSPDSPGFSAQSRRDVIWGIVEGVRSFFGEDEPNFFERISDAAKLGIGIPPHLVPEEGYKDITDVPREVILEISKSPGFLELLVLHEAGYGTEHGRQMMRKASNVVLGHDLKNAINGISHINQTGHEHFGMGAWVLQQILKEISPKI